MSAVDTYPRFIDLPKDVIIADPWDYLTHPSFASARVTVTHRFSARDLMTWWQTFSTDPAVPENYSDATSRLNLEQFLSPTRYENGHFFLIYCHGEVAGASWLHDLDYSGGVCSAWMALYHMPRFRSVIGARSTLAVFELAHRLGVQAIFAACRTTNKAAMRLIRKAGYKHVGTYYGFTTFNGIPGDVHLFSLYDEHRSECWRQARVRAAKNMGLSERFIPTLTT